MPKNVAERLEDERLKFLERGRHRTGRFTANQTGARPLAEQRFRFFAKRIIKDAEEELRRREGEKRSRTIA